MRALIKCLSINAVKNGKSGLQRSLLRESADVLGKPCAMKTILLLKRMGYFKTASYGTANKLIYVELLIHRVTVENTPRQLFFAHRISARSGGRAAAKKLHGYRSLITHPASTLTVYLLRHHREHAEALKVGGGMLPEVWSCSFMLCSMLTFSEETTRLFPLIL